MDRNKNTDGAGERNMNNNRLEGKSSVPGDLPDSQRDKKELENEETFIDLPDVKDIPGQEFVHAPPLEALGDTTISSDDEEGVGVFDTEDADDPTEGTPADVSNEERRTLSDSEFMPSPDNTNLKRARLDNEDFQGASLNEKGFGEELSGDDLDTNVENEDETRADAMGQGDEENQTYSLGSSENDDLDNGRP